MTIALEDIKRQALAARQFDVSVSAHAEQGGQCHFAIRMPTQHELMLASRRAGLHSMGDDLAAHVVLQRSLLVGAVVGWSGVTVGHIVPVSEHAADALPYEPDAVELLLDAQPQWEAELGAELLRRLAERRRVQDTAAKNSES